VHIPRLPEGPDASDGRHLAAIVFADVVGYSRLMAADEVGTHNRWSALYRNRLRPDAERRGERVGDLRGDGVVIEFDNPMNAVEWARTAHVAATESGSGDQGPLALRVAVHQGKVLATSDGLFGDAETSQHVCRNMRHLAGQ
jgi:class 3 adenylate cyclase